MDARVVGLLVSVALVVSVCGYKRRVSAMYFTLGREVAACSVPDDGWGSVVTTSRSLAMGWKCRSLCGCGDECLRFGLAGGSRVRVVDMVWCVYRGVPTPKMHHQNFSGLWPMPSFLPGPGTRSPRGRKQRTDAGIVLGGITEDVRCRGHAH